MRIKLLEDNTITASYDDGVNENINSANHLDTNDATRALSPITESLAKTFIYKGAYDSANDDDGSLVFDDENCRVAALGSRVNENPTLMTIDPLEPLPADPRVKAFCEIVFADIAITDRFIEQLPLVKVMTKSQQVIQVSAGTLNAIEQVIQIPKGEQTIVVTDGVARATTIYEKSIWLLSVVDDSDKPVMAPVQGTDDDGNPLFEHYHKKTDTRYPVATK